MRNRLRELFDDSHDEYSIKIKFIDSAMGREFEKKLEELNATGIAQEINGVEQIESSLKDGENNYSIKKHPHVEKVIIGVSKELVEIPISIQGREQKYIFEKQKLRDKIVIETKDATVIKMRFEWGEIEKKLEFQYNVDMEKAKNINDLLEEYERMEAVIDLFLKKDVENKELEELRRWLTVSINYFRRFQKVLSTLKIKDEKINIKEAEEKEFLVEKIYLLLIENGKIRSNQKIKSINDVEIDKAVIGEPIFVVYVNEQNIDLFGNVITFYMVSSIFNAIAEDIKEDENGKKKLLFSDTDSNPMYRVYSGFLNRKEAEKEEKRVIKKVEEYKEAKTFEEYLEQLREGIV